MSSGVRQHQGGAVTLAVSLLLLFILSLMSLYSARLGDLELHLSNNEYRHAQALAAAGAGLAATLNRLSARHTMLDDTPPPRREMGASLADGSRYVARLNALGENRTEILATGYAADGGSSLELRQVVRFLPYLRRPPPATLTVRHRARLGEDRIFHDRADGTRIWNGGNLTVAGLPVAGDGSACMNLALCPGDARLAALDDDAWLAQFFTLPLETLRRAAVGIAGDLDDGRGGLLLMDNAGGPPLRLRHLRIGSPELPAILFVSGDVDGLGDSHIHGLVFIAGDLRGEIAGLDLRGALVVGGDMDVGAGFHLRRQRTVMSRLMRLGRFARVPGGWRDFGHRP